MDNNAPEDGERPEFDPSHAVKSFLQHGWQMVLDACLLTLTKILFIINWYYCAELVRWFAWFFSQIFWGESLYFILSFLCEATNTAEGKTFCPGVLSCDLLFAQIRKTSIWYKQGDIHPFSQVHCSPTKESLIYKHLLHIVFLQGTFLYSRIVMEKSGRTIFYFLLKLKCLHWQWDERM